MEQFVRAVFASDPKHTVPHLARLLPGHISWQVPGSVCFASPYSMCQIPKANEILYSETRPDDNPSILLGTYLPRLSFLGAPCCAAQLNPVDLSRGAS
ncbi:hypothetical protein DPEC_G00138370 [Dallia pectoralis]|uniref:Uncharacterized protein n=1 Tax=Dallia pectoralis TaxID=75939 RepID=A0ACC2GM62_DALPE|nr:hypothetical protein DPEC_G00138370 [Dallia pectoralis]